MDLFPELYNLSSAFFPIGMSVVVSGQGAVGLAVFLFHL